MTFPKVSLPSLKTMMQKRKDDRSQSAAEIATALSKWIVQASQPNGHSGSSSPNQSRTPNDTLARRLFSPTPYFVGSRLSPFSEKKAKKRFATRDHRATDIA